MVKSSQNIVGPPSEVSLVVFPCAFPFCDFEKGISVEGKGPIRFLGKAGLV